MQLPLRLPECDEQEPRAVASSRSCACASAVWNPRAIGAGASSRGGGWGDDPDPAWDALGPVYHQPSPLDAGGSGDLEHEFFTKARALLHRLCRARKVD